MKRFARWILRQELADMDARADERSIACYTQGIQDGFVQGRIYGEAISRGNGVILGIDSQIDKILRDKKF